MSKLTYQDGYTADIYWSSSNSAILNASTGAFSKPSYDSTVTLTATIISYLDGSIEAQDYISFEYTVEGEFLCPTKADIEVFLSTIKCAKPIVVCRCALESLYAVCKSRVCRHYNFLYSL